MASTPAAKAIVCAMAVFDHQPRSATVRAAGAARVLTLDKRAFLRQIHDDPTPAWRVLEQMSGTIHNVDSELARVKRGAE